MPSLEVGVAELIREASAHEPPKPELPEEAAALAQIDETAKEMEEVV